MIGIYKITSPSNKIYIGKSVNIEKRISKYKNLNCKSQRKLYNSLLKYGFKSHTIEVIEICLEDSLIERERYWQDYYDVINFGLNCLLSKTSNTKGKISVETKLLLSKVMKGKNKGIKRSLEFRQNVSDRMKGKIFSHETKSKMSLARLNVIISEETKKKMKLAKLNMLLETKEKLIKYYKERKNKSCKIVLDTQTGIFYESAKEASLYSIYKYDIITNYLNGKRKNKTNLIYV